ncbi:MAG: hypothetical protein ACLUFZ_06525 [Oscillospiraceae bacterium]|jgi:hypothetical protein
MIDKGRNKSRRIIEKKRTARREKMYQAVEKIINLLVSIATVLSVLLTYFTLSEMKEERESAYRPDIQFNSVEYVVQTSADMELFSEVNNCPVYTSDQYGNADIHFKLNLEARNIGVGTAKNVQISITKESSFKAIEEFNEQSTYCDMMYNEGIHGYLMEYSNKTYALLLQFEKTDKFPYILPNAEEVCNYELPDVYYCLINAMRIEHQNIYYDPFSESIMIPDIEVKIVFSDVQGVQYEEKGFIHTEKGWSFKGGQSLVVTILPSESKG